MATYDNKHWLLSNIRNSFMSTDDTRMCEIVMAGENFPKQLYNKAQEAKNKARDSPLLKTTHDTDSSISEHEALDVVTEYDPYPDMEDNEDDMDLIGSYIRYEDFGPIRQRSNTAQWLDKKEQAMKKAAKIKVIKWEDPPIQLTDEERAQMFPKKDLTNEMAAVKPKAKSLLTDQLEKCPHLPHRQYLEYAKFDGTAQLGLPTKTFRIFMNFLPEEHQNYPITICIVAYAKIQELIGFTCYKYSIEHPEILLGSVEGYGLCIAEDDGEVDWTFPCLEAVEPCAKFGFSCLGLVELRARSLDHAPLYPTFCKDSLRHNTGGSASSDAALKAFQGFDSDNTSRVEDKKGAGPGPGPGDQDIDKINSYILATEAPQYKAYRVQLLHRALPLSRTSVQLGVALDCIDIEPSPHAHSYFWSKWKHVSYAMDSVVRCHAVHTNTKPASTSKTVFRIVYAPRHAQPQPHSPAHQLNCSGTSNFLHSTSYKHHDFETDCDTAKEVIEKVNRILDLRNSACRRDYQSSKEKKVLQSRRSYHVKQMS